MADTDISYGRIRQESRFDQTGAETVSYVVPIYIGKHGPFTERFTSTEYLDGFSVQQRVEQLKASLSSLPK